MPSAPVTPTAAATAVAAAQPTLGNENPERRRTLVEAFDPRTISGDNPGDMAEARDVLPEEISAQKSLVRTKKFGLEDKGVVIAMRPTPARKKQLEGLGGGPRLGAGATGPTGAGALAPLNGHRLGGSRGLESSASFFDDEDIEEVDLDADLDF